MTIRARSADDLDAAVEALRAVYEASGYPTRWPADPAGWLDPPELVGAWVAERDGAVAGHVGLAAGRSEPGLAAATGVPVESLVLVTRLFVAPAARGLGLARALLSVVGAHASDAGLTLGLDVIERSVDAITLYESLGWRYVSSARAQWRTQDGEHPMIRYYLAP